MCVCVCVCVCVLQIEQMEQKKEKRQRSVMFAVNRSFNGAICPLSHGAKVCCCPPCMDEQRLKVQPGDQILVSRMRKCVFLVAVCIKLSCAVVQLILMLLFFTGWPKSLHPKAASCY